MDDAIVVQGVRKKFDKVEVLKGIDLNVRRGEILAVMGSSGGGKTTLLKCISGLTLPDEGTVEVEGIDVAQDPEAARHKMGMVFQSAALFDYLNVYDNVAFGARRWLHLKGKKLSEKVEETLSSVGLEDVGKLMPSELSGGMKKRVGIARALALEPAVMLYDEPTTGLDPVTTYTIDSLIVQVRNTLKVTSLVVSHDVTAVVRVADRIAFLDQGQIAFLGTPAEFEREQHASIRELVQKSQAKSLSASE